MNINKYLKLTVVCLFTLIAYSACDNDFEEINENPNGPVTVPPGLLITGIQEATADELYNTFLGGDMGETWVQHWGKVQYNEEERYNIRPGVNDTFWDRLYARSLKDAQVMYDLAKEADNKNIQGVALVMRSYVYSILTDAYGAIPYTEALQAEEGNSSPAYDKQDVIYPALIDSLEVAAALLAPGNGEIPAAQDLMYGGDPVLWEKFANSLRVRLLMRISYATDVSAELQSVVSGGNLFSSNADEAKLVFRETNPNANPVWNTVVFTNRLEWKVNQTLVQKLQELSDPRLPVYAQPNEDDEYRGVAPGIDNPVESGFGYANVSPIGEFFLQPDAPGYFLSYSELNFLLAEAAKRGLITGGDALAEEYYNEGITASFETYNGFVPEEGDPVSLDAEAYLSQSGVAYSAATALQQIGVQNWIALFGQGFEAWTEWRRTGFPALSPALDPIGIETIPTRYPYPTNEQTLNNANYSEAVSNLEGGDNLTSEVWWDKKD